MQPIKDFLVNLKRQARFVSVSVRYAVLLILVSAVLILAGCGSAPEGGDPELTKNVQLELVDWHISGLMIINSPVVWVKVTNYNPVTVKNITFEYDSFDENGQFLDRGTFTIEDTVYPGESRNFIELYVGLVNVRTEALKIKLLSVSRA